MGIFDKFKKKNNNINSSAVYEGKPSFYNKPDGSIFGSFALTENTLSRMPKNPKSCYKIDGNEVAEWKVCFISITKKAMIGDMDYYNFLNKVKNYTVDENEDTITIRNLSLKEMEEILGC